MYSWHYVIHIVARAFLSLQCLLGATWVYGDERAEALLEEVQAATDKAKTLSADFSYITIRPTEGGGSVTSKNIGTLRLMKPNFADIRYNPQSRYGKQIVSDGKQIWTFSNMTLSHTKTKADPEGKNINVWRLVTVGGFFDIHYWVERGIYVRDLKNLRYAGVEKINDIEYEVLEHEMTGTIQGKSCPFHQKLYIGPEKLVTRFTLDFTLDGKPGSEVAELTNIKIGEPMQASDFVFKPPKEQNDQAPSEDKSIQFTPGKEGS